jgi:riboflavin kinase / FMN adenylyltransferase
LETFFEAKPGLLSQSAIALGFFDGVHAGHKEVIGSALSEARRLGVKPGVVTFRDHPRTLTQGTTPLLLTVIEQRLSLFEELGVEAALVLCFDEELCRLTPREYVENILVGAMGAKSISVGYNHHFGRDREGNPDLLKELGEELGFSVKVAQEVDVAGQEVSSSRIREALFAGHLDRANGLLSRPYAVYGQVIKGDGRGRSIGFPTANLSLYEFQVVPKIGVYAGTVAVDNRGMIPCVINVGHRPTFKESDSSKDRPVVEVHVLDFDDNLYGKNVDVSFCKHLRNEQKFAGIDELKKQISLDCLAAVSYFQKKSEENSEPYVERTPA